LPTLGNQITLLRQGNFDVVRSRHKVRRAPGSIGSLFAIEVEIVAAPALAGRRSGLTLARTILATAAAGLGAVMVIAAALASAFAAAALASAFAAAALAAAALASASAITSLSAIFCVSRCGQGEHSLYRRRSGESLKEHKGAADQKNPSAKKIAVLVGAVEGHSDEIITLASAKGNRPRRASQIGPARRRMPWSDPILRHGPASGSRVVPGIIGFPAALVSIDVMVRGITTRIRATISVL
jgi:hypothetical protein